MSHRCSRSDTCRTGRLRFSFDTDGLLVYVEPVPRYTERPPLHPRGFDFGVDLPYDLRVAEIRAGMDAFYDFVHAANSFMSNQGWNRLEETLSAATFSTLVSELVVQSVSAQSAAVIANQHHNGRPDLVPRGHYPEDRAQRGTEGVEVKASRNTSGWQGHNAETGWIMIFQYVVDATTLPVEERAPTRFVRVLCANLEESDWSFSGRSPTSRRTITASILQSGLVKLTRRPLYQDPTLVSPSARRSRGG